MSNTTNKQFQDYGLPYSDFQKNIEFLYKKIDNCTRKLSYFDLYKITTVVNNSSELEAKITSLPPYSSLVINTPIKTSTGSLYSIGDVILKNNDGTFSVIPAQRGGIFCPTEISKIDGSSSSYNIRFEYIPSPPEKNSTAVIDDVNNKWTVSDPKQSITFKGINIESSGSPYNHILSSSSITFPQATDTAGNPIPPIVNIKWQNEDIYTDVSITPTGSDYIVSVPSNMSLNNYQVVIK